MGQAWCKERSTKTQDSKSPLDRVFVRCAHRIYPGLKEEGSVLGGATQRVTSSEIGYAGSPPREILARGRSIDSVDRPFHPSDWVDVNLEVPGPPRVASSVLAANSTVEASPYPATTPTSSCTTNMKDVTPVPPPRRKKRNRGRPLPPKPDEIPENASGNLKRGGASEEPLRPSSTGSPKTDGDEREDDDDAATRMTERTCAEDARHDGRRTKEIYEHKVNGTGRIISSDVVSGKRTSADKKTSRTSEPSHYHHHRKVLENEEYERFAWSQSIKDSSTPNRQDRRKPKELGKRITDSSRDDDRPEANTRTKNYSTVSLPNYDELDVSRHPAKGTTEDERGAPEKMKPKRPVRSSTGSLPVESFLSPFSEKTSVCLEDYIPRRGSIEHMSPYRMLGKLGSSENEVTDDEFMKYDPSKLEDWDLSDISNCDLNLRRDSAENLPRIEIYSDESAVRRPIAGVDVVDCSSNAESGEAETTEVEVSCVRRDMTSPLMQKPETFGKAASLVSSADKQYKYHDDLFADRDRYFEAPTMSELSQASPVRELASSPARGEPFFLNEQLHRSVLDTIGGSSRNGAVVHRESDRSAGQSRLIFGRSLSNESEPYDEPYESKELRAHSDLTSKLIRTISEESLPREMLEGVDEEEVIVDFFDEGLAKDLPPANPVKDGHPDQRVMTPLTSPEPKIKARILNNDHSSLLKVLNDEAAAADGSNLSSMTPSLTELEVALSDMLEKEDQPDEHQANASEPDGSADPERSCQAERLLEPRIVPVEKSGAPDDTMACPMTPNDVVSPVDDAPERKTDRQSSVSLEEILGSADPMPKTRKVSFCTWEDKIMTEVELKNDNKQPETRGVTASPVPKNSVVKPELAPDVTGFFGNLMDVEVNVRESAMSVGEAPEKPDRPFGNLDEAMAASQQQQQQIPTPPRRRNRSSGMTQGPVRTAESNREEPDDLYPNDRLI